MKKHNNNKNISRSKLPIIALLMALGILGTIISCETEDDIPPPSAYVPPTPEPEPEPGEDCVFSTIVPELSEGIDFECGGPEVTFFGEKDGSFTLEYVENPDASGINTSETVVEYTQTADIEPWAGFFFDLASKVDFSEMQTVKIKVYSPAADQIVLLKFEDKTDNSIAKEVQATTTVANEWEELSFVFSPSDSDKFDRLILFFDFNGEKSAETTHYFDDIVMSEGGEVEEPVETSEPTAPATDPNIDPTEVISLFSDVYTNVTVDTWRTDWSNATLEDIEIDGNAVKKYSELNVAGIEATSNPIDATGMTHFRTDIWTGDATEFRIKLVDFGADGAYDGGDDVEHEIVFEAPTQQEWVSLDIPLSDFTGLTTKEHIAQLLFISTPSGANTVFVDNVFFYNEAGVSDTPLSGAPTPTVPDNFVISVFSDTYTDVSGTDFNPNWGQATVVTQEDIAGNNTLKYDGLNYQGTQFENALDVSGMTMIHLDYWTPDSSDLNLSLVSTGPVEIPYSINVTTGQWVSVDIPLTEFSDTVDLTDVIQLKFDGNGTIFLDNIYFYSPPPTEPAAGAPAPTLPQADVISIFSDTYTDLTDTDFNPNWGQATVVTQENIDGNNTLKYENLNYQGTQLSSSLDVSGMTMIHLDYWTPDSSALNLSLISTGPVETPYAIEVTAGQWVSVDIPLTEFSGVVDLTDVIQLKFDGNGTIFLDNIYFH
ncbi:hypothetical protein J0656_15255 [Muricauda ruestringensis]|uniref:CBM11 domain-containing protein n=1 Tax=Flagellimonas aurea TaxID=2915619 RepID=A0ABS3G7W9_9FLAO|nr:hypothetical protein [Allomuricauda aurea]MBO0355378.1 hypothetical protein [Allomuricauda aurea]|tara:strand:- start:2118 stop:4253 length:2136 start_codon:yes stop_codon:yes gene_type:complete